jgi:hypothetical protein
MRKAHTLDSSRLSVDNDGLQELVIFALLVSFLDCGYNILRSFTFAGNKTLEGNLHTLPSKRKVRIFLGSVNRNNFNTSYLCP